MSELTDLRKENETLKCQVNELKVYIGAALQQAFSKERDSILHDARRLTPNYCLNSVRTDAVRDLANTCYPVSGYIITSEESRKQMIQWAELEEAING